MNYNRAKFLSRLLAIIYDVLIVFFITVITIILIQMLIGLGKEIPADSFINTILKSFWVLIAFAYFGYYWTTRGETPGMRVWKIRVLSNDGELISWKSALYRFVFALLGLGLLWIPFDKKHLALQDRLSHTLLIRTHR